MSVRLAASIINHASAAYRAPVGRALLLDRDGVINVNFGYVHTAERTEWVDGIFELCRAAQVAGYALVVVTNQAGIARGIYSEEQFAAYTQWMLEQFNARGIHILRIYYCPHHAAAGQGSYRHDCECRKPRPGMIMAAAQDLGIDLASSLMIGDKASDMEAARAAGVGRYVQIRDPGESVEASNASIIYTDNLWQACEIMMDY
jgi:D-glycero-D-manno-heptose 1,7-bisphosphate phosphatase